jgi:hypothetical protein
VSVNSRRKGKAGELGASRVLTTVFDLAVRPGRQLAQSRDGGIDLAPEDTPIAVEVKRRKLLPVILNRWHQQVTSQAGDRPVRLVMCREDHGPWLFVLDAASMIALVGWLRKRFEPAAFGTGEPEPTPGDLAFMDALDA